MALEKIEGREDDVFILEGTNGDDVKLYPDVIRRCLLYTDEIKAYQVIQQDKNTQNVRLEYTNDKNEKDKTLMRA